MTKSQVAIGLGCLLALAGTFADIFLASDYVTFALLISGIIVMVFGLRIAQRAKKSAEPASPSQRSRRFALYIFLTALPAVPSFFAMRHAHPDFSFGLSIGICGFTFVICVAIFYWQLFVRAK